MKGFFKLAALVAAFGFAFAFAGCSNGGDDNGALLAVISGGGGTNPAPETPTTPTPAATYTITFNANDGSENPATDTQTFTEKTPQTLKTIDELGFFKSGFNFAGWGTSADASQASYADASSYTATADATLYALWSEIPVYSVKISINDIAKGNIVLTRATAPAGTNMTLTIEPTRGYELESLTVKAADGTEVPVTVTGNICAFTMPAQNVRVTAKFKAINYIVNIETLENGSVSSSSATATVGQTVTLTASPATNYKFETLTVTADGGTPVSVSGTSNTRTFKMPAQNVTVTATFSLLPYKKIGTQNINGVEYDLFTFGLFPQTIKADSVTIDEVNCQKETHGSFTYCKGSDGEWYVKQIEAADQSGYKYSDGTVVAQRSANSEKWFKVEPIKWRALTTNYGGNKLLLAENILIAASYWEIPGYSIGDNIIYANNYKYSSIRAYLNGSYEADGEKLNDLYSEKGFLQSAFTSEQQAAIKTTTVDNSAASTTDAGGNLTQATSYKCDNTSDKIFLLSEKEVTTSAYGFPAYNDCGLGNSRIRTTTDFAKASGAWQDSVVYDFGMWWLRSPSNSNKYIVYYVYSNGWAGTTGTTEGCYDGGSVVPALCVEN